MCWLGRGVHHDANGGSIPGNVLRFEEKTSNMFMVQKRQRVLPNPWAKEAPKVQDSSRVIRVPSSSVECDSSPTSSVLIAHPAEGFLVQKPENLFSLSQYQDRCNPRYPSGPLEGVEARPALFWNSISLFHTSSSPITSENIAIPGF